MEVYTTIEGCATAEIVEKKSRFIGQLCHVETEEEALGFLEEVRTEHAQARHNVYAYILRTQAKSQPQSQTQHQAKLQMQHQAKLQAQSHVQHQARSHAQHQAQSQMQFQSPANQNATPGPTTNRIRYSDDGEPAKTAGIPTLEVLQHAGLENVACVVTRYFGGTLLGTGGLVRAYTQATKAAIEAAHIVTISPCVELSLDIPYSLYDQVVKLSDKCNVRIVSADFLADVHVVFRMQDGMQKDVREKLTELTSGNALIAESAVFYAMW